MHCLPKLKFFFLLLLFSNGSLFANKKCFDEALFNRKNLRDVYLTLRAASAHCDIATKTYIHYAERAIVAERYAEALWVAQRGQNKANQQEKYQLWLLQGQAFLHLKRTEEAITVLKKVAYDKSLYQLASTQSAFAHLLLLKSYYLRAGKKKDKNVLFLYNLFQTRYTKNIEREWLEAWFSHLK